MIVRIRFGGGHKVGKTARRNRRMALAAAAMLIPAALMAAALGFWRLAADLGLTGPFAIQSGLLSHWLVWVAAALTMLAAARSLNRYGHGEDEPGAG